MKNGKLRVAVAGLGFGGAFVPIWIKHPDVYAVDIIEVKEEVIDKYLKNCPNLGINKIYHSLDEALAEPEIDAVHLITPIPLHAKQSLQVLRSGKHCACTVPAAVTLEDLFALVRAQKETGKNYMMMETAAYTFQILMVEKMLKAGELGRIQMLRGCHYQDMEYWPSYWLGLPPMHYGTHAISPLLKLAGTRATEVVCFGSGTMREELHKQYGNPYPAETALFRLANSPAVMEVTRTLFETAREYCEGFTVYGSKKTFEWNIGEECYWESFVPSKAEEKRGFQIRCERITEFPDTGNLLPPEIGRFTIKGNYDDTNPQNTFVAGGGHHGSHPHMIHEFARSIIENRLPAIDAVKAAEWTGAGICAHLSAMKNGVPVTIPDFAKEY